MTGETQKFPYVSPGPIKLPPGSLEPVEEHPGDSDLDDDGSQAYDSLSDAPLSNLDEDEEEDEGTLRERDSVFEKIKESLSKTQRSDSVSELSTISDSSDGPHVQISDHYTSIPYGIQPKATYEHSSMHADIMGVAYNNRMRQFVILDSKGITTWKRDQVDPRDLKLLQNKDLTPKTFNLNAAQLFGIRRALQYPKYEYRLIVQIVYAAKYNCYFALGKDFSLKVLNREFEETCSVDSDLRSVLFMLFNPVKDELITGGVGGLKFWQFKQKAGQSFQELKPLANYRLEFLYALPNVGGSWVKRVDLDHYLQHLYCCSDTDLHVYDLNGKLLFKFERAHTMSITGCCFSPSAKVLITSSVDSEVKVWSLTGGLVHTFRGHSRAVTSLLLHPETSSIVLTSSLDGSFRMWSLDTMDQLYMLVVSTDGVLWMGLTDDRFLYISTCRNITMWHLNNFYSLWGLARNQVSRLSLASCEDKTTRLVATGEDSSVRIFCRSNQKNITTVLPPPDISALQSVLSVCYSREKNAAFLLVTNKEIWVYTTRTDPACRIAVWDVHELQLPYISGDTSNLPPGVIIQPPSTTMGTHRATENGHGNEIVSNCCSLCILNSTAMMMTDEGLCCPIRHTYLLLGLEDGRILFMDPVIRGQKYMEFKACKDAVKEMRHDVPNSCLITLCHLKELMIVQIWGLPQLDAMYEVYCAPDITCYARIGLSFLCGHTSGHLNFCFLEPIEDHGAYKAKQEPNAEDVIDNSRRAEHASAIVAMDSSSTLRVFCTCSSDGAIKIWDENKFLMTEVMLEESLSAACFLNDLGDLLVGFKNHIFYIDHAKLCPQIKPPDIEMETSDQESDVYEDPRVLYELIEQNPEPITKENYLVPYPNIEFDKDFLEGITKIEQHKAPIKSDESGSESESDVSLAPSSVYLSPPESPNSLSMIDLTLGSDYSKYDLKHQMKNTLDYIFKRVLEEKNWKRIPESRRELILRRLQKKSKSVRASRKHHKIVSMESPGPSDLEEKEADMEVEKFALPIFGDSPGPSPSVTPPTVPSSPRSEEPHIIRKEVPTLVIESDEEKEEPAPESTFVPVEPATISPLPWNMESPDSQLANLEKASYKSDSKSIPQNLHVELDDLEQFSAKTDLDAEGSSVSELVRESSSKDDLKKNLSETEFASFQSDMHEDSKESKVAVFDKNASHVLETNVKSQRLSTKLDLHSKAMPSASNANIAQAANENDKAVDSNTGTGTGYRNSHQPLLSINKITPIEMRPYGVNQIGANKSITKTTSVELRKVTSGAEMNKSALVETDNKSSVSDSGFGSEYSARTFKTDLGSLMMTGDKTAASEMSDSESLATQKSGQQFDRSETLYSEKSKLFEIKSPTESRSHTPRSRQGGHPSARHDNKKMGAGKKKALSPDQDSSLGIYPEGESRKYGIKAKVDVKGLMKKRRVTSGRAPSLTRRASGDHSHEDHDHHGSEHGHDDKRPRKEFMKKQQQQLQERKLPTRLDRNKLLELPPNPPSMLTRKNSMSKDRKNLEIQLLHHPDYRRGSKDFSQDPEFANVKYDSGQQEDLEQAQEELWRAEASLHGTQLAVPPQRDPNKARLSDQPNKVDPRSLRNRNRKPMFGDTLDIDTHIPGVGSSPTAELEDDTNDQEMKEDLFKKRDELSKIEVSSVSQSQGESQTLKEPQDDQSLINRETNTPETQMQREQRLGLKVTSEVFQDGDNKKGVPKVLMQRSKLNIYLPKADGDSTSTKSSHRGTPDSGVDDIISLPGGQTPIVSVRKHIDDQQAQVTEDLLLQDLDEKKDESLLTDDDKAQAVRRPASSFTGLRRGQLEGERLKAERPHTAHVRFKAELEFIVELPDHLEDLQAAFEEALERYQTLPGTPSSVSPEKLYRNDGTSFEDNWQERIIERHILLRMQREIRAQSAAQRREAYGALQQDRRNRQYTRSCDSAVGPSRSESTISTVKRANTSMSMPIRLGRGSAPPTARDKQRPQTAHPVLQKKQQTKIDLGQEKAFRYRLSQDQPFSARSTSSGSSLSTVRDFSPHWIDPRNPDAWRPKSSRSIPSKCHRYVLISKPKDAFQAPVPSPLEEQLLIERFPKMGARVLQTVPEPVPKVKKSYNMEYSPFVYQRFV